MVYDIPDLDAGTLYYVRVSAISSIGTSDSTLAANNPVAPSQHPDAPADMAAEAIIGSSVELNSEIEVRKGQGLGLRIKSWSAAISRRRRSAGITALMS